MDKKNTVIPSKGHVPNAVKKCIFTLPVAATRPCGAAATVDLFGSNDFELAIQFNNPLPKIIRDRNYGQPGIF